MTVYGYKTLLLTDIFYQLFKPKKRRSAALVLFFAQKLIDNS